MPTIESAEAFSRLVAARTRLIRLTRMLNRAHGQRHDTRDARFRYERTQNEWQEAYCLFTKATAEFSESVKRIPQQVGLEETPDAVVDTLSMLARTRLWRPGDSNPVRE